MVTVLMIPKHLQNLSSIAVGEKGFVYWTA